MSKKTALLLHSYDFITRHQVLTCVFFPQSHFQCDKLLSHSFDIVELKIQRMGYRDFQLRDKIWNYDAVTCHTVV